MQIVYEVSKPTFWKKWEKPFKMLSAKFFTQIALLSILSCEGTNVFGCQKIEKKKKANKIKR